MMILSRRRMKRISSFIYSKISFRLNIHSSSSDLNIEQWLKQIVYYIKKYKKLIHIEYYKEKQILILNYNIFKRRKYLENYSTKLDEIQIRYVHNLL